MSIINEILHHIQIKCPFERRILSSGGVYLAVRHYEFRTLFLWRIRIERESEGIISSSQYGVGVILGLAESFNRFVR